MDSGSGGPISGNYWSLSLSIRRNFGAECHPYFSRTFGNTIHIDAIRIKSISTPGEHPWNHREITVKSRWFSSIRHEITIKSRSKPSQIHKTAIKLQFQLQKTFQTSIKLPFSGVFQAQPGAHHQHAALVEEPGTWSDQSDMPWELSYHLWWWFCKYLVII